MRSGRAPYARRTCLSGRDRLCEWAARRGFCSAARRPGPKFMRAGFLGEMTADALPRGDGSDPERRGNLPATPGGPAPCQGRHSERPARPARKPQCPQPHSNSIVTAGYAVASPRRVELNCRVRATRVVLRQPTPLSMQPWLQLSRSRLSPSKPSSDVAGTIVRFLCRMMIALIRRRIWASVTRRPSTASDVQSRKWVIHPFRYRLRFSMPRRISSKCHRDVGRRRLRRLPWANSGPNFRTQRRAVSFETSSPRSASSSSTS